MCSFFFVPLASELIIKTMKTYKRLILAVCSSLIFNTWMQAQEDVTTTYLSNPSFEANASSCTTSSGSIVNNGGSDLRGWNITPSNWTTTNPGVALLINGDCNTDNNFGKTGMKDGSYAYYQRVGWTTASSEMKQTSKVALAAGEYKLTFFTKAFYVNSATSNAYVTVKDSKSATLADATISFKSGSNGIMTSSAWDEQTLAFVLKEESKITISSVMTWLSGGSCIAYDHFTLTKLPTGSIDPDAPTIEGGTEDELDSPTEGLITHDFVNEETMQNDLLQMIANSMRYAKNIWYNCAAPNSANETCGYFQANSAGQNNEDGVRTNADFSMLCAFLYKYGQGKVTLPTGITWTDVKDMAMKSLVFGYSTHKANKLKITSNNAYWGSVSTSDAVWESSLWTMSLAYASYFLDAELTDSQKNYIYKMIKAECNYELYRSIPTGFNGDTKSEENGWEACVLACALGLYPNDALAPQWFKRLREFAINSYSQVNDANNNTIIDPDYDQTTVSDLYVGPNLYNDFTLQNHNYFHTSYQNVVIQELGEAQLALLMFQGENPKWKTNALMHNNQNVMDHVLRHLALADGELAMPNGNDWSMFLYDQITSYSTLACFLRDKDALMLENMAYKHIKARQSTTADGSWLLNSDIGPRRMGVEGHRVMMSYLMHELASTADMKPTTWEDFSNANSDAHLFTTQNIVRANTKERFSVFSWSGGLKSYTGYIASNRPDMNKIIVPYKANNTGNLLGWYTVNGKGTNAAPTANGVYQLNGNSYTMNGRLDVNDKTLDNNFAIYSTPGNAFIYMDYVVGKSSGTITGEYNGLLAISVDKFTKEKRTLYHKGGRIQTDGASMKSFNSNWVNIDNQVGVISTKANNKVAFGDRQLSNSVYIARLYPTYSNTARTFSNGSIVDKRHIIYYNNVNAETTAQLETQVISLTDKVPTGWNGIIVSDPDSVRYLFMSNFLGTENCTLQNVITTDGAPVFTTITHINANGASTQLACTQKRSIANTLRIYATANDITAVQEKNDSCTAYISNNTTDTQEVKVVIYADNERLTATIDMEATTTLLVKVENGEIVWEEANIKNENNPLTPTDYTNTIIDPSFENSNNSIAWKGSPVIGGNADNLCAEKWNTTFDIYQKLSGLPNGQYKIVMQGFYRCGGYEEAANLRKNGFEKLNASLYANSASMPIMSIFEEASSKEMNGPSCVNTIHGLIPNQMTDASVAFSNQLYTHELVFEVTDGTATIGVKKTASVSNDWTIFDNFKLYRLTKEYTLNIPECGWETLMLPFSHEIPENLTFNSCAEIQGDRLKLAEEATIVANTPYIIKGEMGEYSFSGVPTDTETLTHSSGILTGTYTDIYAPKNSYTFQTQENPMGFHRVQEENAIEVKAHHAYLTVDSNADVLLLPDGSNIKEINAYGKKVNVYDINGVLIKKDVTPNDAMKGLKHSTPKVYIVDGEKVIH